jgi:lysophospholipase L1-like esterase
MTISKFFALGLLVFSFLPALADDVFWPVPTVPAGVNPATYPEARLDWVMNVKSRFDEAKGKNFDFILDGDSITDFWRGTGKAVFAERLAKYNAMDFGISGDRTQHLLWRLAHGQVDGLTPKLVMLMIGTNNLNSTTNDQIVEGVKAIVTDYEKRCPTAHILLLGIFPRGPMASDPDRIRVNSINEQLSVISTTDKRVTYLDIGPKFLQPDGTLTKEIMPDFLHPSAAGYKIWADAIQPVLDQYFPDKK